MVDNSRINKISSRIGSDRSFASSRREYVNPSEQRGAQERIMRLKGKINQEPDSGPELNFFFGDTVSEDRAASNLVVQPERQEDSAVKKYLEFVNTKVLKDKAADLLKSFNNNGTSNARARSGPNNTPNYSLAPISRTDPNENLNPDFAEYSRFVRPSNEMGDG